LCVHGFTVAFVVVADAGATLPVQLRQHVAGAAATLRC